MYHIETIIPEQGRVILPELITLLQDAVASGASVGFLPPLSEEEAREGCVAKIFKLIKKKCIL